MISRLIIIGILQNLFDHLSQVLILLTSCNFILFLHFEDMFYIPRLVRQDLSSRYTFYTWADLQLLHLTFLIPRPGYCSQSFLYLSIDRVISQNLRAYRILPTQRRKNIRLRFLSPVTSYDFIILHDNSTTLHNVITLHDNSIVSYDLIN